MCFKHDSQAFISSSNPLKWQHKYKSLTDHPELVFKHQGCNQLLGIITRPGCMITDGYALLTQKLMHDPSDFMKFSRKSLKLCNKNLSNLSLLLTKNFLLTMVFCYKNWPSVRKNCSSDREKLLKFETEGQEFEICSNS